MKIADFNKLVTEVRVNMSITMMYGHHKPQRIIIRPYTIRKLGREVYISDGNRGCYCVSKIVSIIEVNN